MYKVYSGSKVYTVCGGTREYAGCTVGVGYIQCVHLG